MSSEKHTVTVSEVSERELLALIRHHATHIDSVAALWGSHHDDLRSEHALTMVDHASRIMQLAEQLHRLVQQERQ